MKIWEAATSDLRVVGFVERAAFDREDEASLVGDLPADASARPLLSLLAYEGQQPLGHIHFTRARLRDAPRDIAILLPWPSSPPSRMSRDRTLRCDAIPQRCLGT